MFKGYGLNGVSSNQYASFHHTVDEKDSFLPALPIQIFDISRHTGSC